MRIRYISFLLLLLLAACTSKTAEQKEQIQQMHADLYASQNGKYDMSLAHKLDEAYKNFATDHPDDSLAPVYVYADAQLQQNIFNNLDEANVLYQRLVKSYPDHKLAPDALFSAAFNYEKTGQESQARAAYTMFLEKYPNSDLADDAKFSLENMGKSLDDMVKGFEAKQDSTGK